MSVCRMDDSPWCQAGTCAQCDAARGVRMFSNTHLTVEEAQWVLSHAEGPERSGLEPTSVEKSLMRKMRAVIDADRDSVTPRDDAEREAVRAALAARRKS